MRLALLTNASPLSGVGYYATHLKQALQLADPSLVIDEFMMNGTTGTIQKNGQEVARIPTWPGFLRAKTVTWIRLRNAMAEQLQHAGSYDVYHATNQTLSFLVEERQPWVVTVHDIIELTDPQTVSGRLAAKYLYKGIPLAKQGIAVSDFTSQQVQQAYPLSSQKISTIPNGVGEPFVYISGFASSPACTQLCEQLSLPTEGYKILYVGSNHPRKNVTTALRVFAKILQDYPDAIFIKVGSPGLKSGEVAMNTVIQQLGLANSVRIIGDISDQTLAHLYNAANVLLFPSTLEGFGLPLLQAMACGLPIVASNASSIPEVVGEAAWLRDPMDVDGMAEDVQRVLEDAQGQADVVQKGLARAKQFNWVTIAAQTLDIYRKAQL